MGCSRGVQPHKITLNYVVSILSSLICSSFMSEFILVFNGPVNVETLSKIIMIMLSRYIDQD